MVAAARAGVAAIGHELFGRQTRLKRSLVQKLGVLHQLQPVVRGVDVDFNHARVGCDLQHFQSGIAWRWIAFEHDAHAQLFGGGFDGAEQIKVVL